MQLERRKMRIQITEPYTGEEIEAFVAEGMQIAGIIHTENNCCPGKPVIITVNNTFDGRKNYSAQCACDGWCSTGTSSIRDAIHEWDKMNARFHKRQQAGKNGD